MIMKVGISFRPNDSLFYSGLNQTALLLAELFSENVVLVTNQDAEWVADSYPKNVATSPLYQATDLDLLIDIDGLLPADMRQRSMRSTGTIIVFLRTFLQFSEMDDSVYLEKAYTPRSFQGVKEVWCWDVLNPACTIPSIQALFPPIRRVPFIWSPSVTEHYAKMESKEDSKEDSKETIVHIAEKNRDNTSSSLLPLVAIRELSRMHSMKFMVHNMEVVKDNRFLQENVLNNIESSLLPLTLVPKEPFYQWKKGDILFSHSRFVPLRIGLLHALWLGFPVIHNSPVLKELHPQLADWFYQGNSVSGIVAAFEKLGTPCSEIRDAIMARFGIEAHRDAWNTIRKEIVGSVPTVHPMPCIRPASRVPPSHISIAFSDMWPGFNPDSNFIMDALRQETECTGIPYSVGCIASLLVCGPYSETWRSISSIPKVFFSAENGPLPNGDISLFLTSSVVEDATHLRIPTWMTFIDWTSGSTVLPTNTEDNPIRLPLHFATTSHPVPFSKRESFCAFVVSNPCCTIRNRAFEVVNGYKPVNSGGALYNTIGGPLALKYPGGGCGDLSKHHFFADHRFTISFENSQAPGYVTEKLLHAKMAGCVPLYWGDTTNDFDPESYVNLSTLTDSEKLVEVIRILELNPDMCEEMARRPLLDAKRVSSARAQIKRMAQQILGLIGGSVPRPNLDGIHDIMIINLDTRPDRWTRLLDAEPFLQSATRISGINGKTLKMTDELYHLFEKNEFQWKKSIMGCNLSHISVWKRVAALPEGSAVLVLEDDVRFVPGWRERWPSYQRHAPTDADLLYLGGVLPPNKGALPLASMAVNSHWSKIMPNTFFSPVPREVFHFCAYSYVLTQKGAQKLVRFLSDSEQRSFTVSDHLLGHPDVGLIKYHANPLLSFCFQEEDPVYVTSQFNELHREDTFDSDIWNNTECVSDAELAPYRMQANELAPYRMQAKELAPYRMQAKELAPSMKTLYYMPQPQYSLYEKQWLDDLFGPIRLVPLENIELGPHSWFIVQRPFVAEFVALFHRLQDARIPFHVLHLSDEFEQDDVSFYTLSCCQTVIRNYLRPGLSAHVIPLGYHHRYNGPRKTMHERELVWSFHGTDWFDRSKQLIDFISFVPYRCNLQPHWNHPTKTRENDYLTQLGNSIFCPILKGQNAETFRLYEALEAGTLPVTTISDSTWVSWIEAHLGLSALYPWTQPAESLAIKDRERLEEIRVEVGARWETWKKEVKDMVRGS